MAVPKLSVETIAIVRPPRMRERDWRVVERGTVGVRRGEGERRERAERRRGVKRRVRMTVGPIRGCECR